MRVRIKTWEAMEEEFGLDDDGDINNKYSFVDMMEEVIPEDRIIEVEEDEDIYLWDCDSQWYISKDMVEEFLD